MTKRKTKYRNITLMHPAGSEYEPVRTFPPVSVPTERETSGSIFVYVEDRYGYLWNRKCIDHGVSYPSAFVAWDDDAGEWALHQPGALSVSDDTEHADIPQPNAPTMNLLQPEVRGIFEPKAKSGRKCRSLREWFLSLSDSNKTPDFLRDKESS